jgi:uncharacterized membrane protein
MKRLREFFKSAVIGGLLVVLPSAIFLFIVTWLFGAMRGIIRVIVPATAEVAKGPDSTLMSVGVDMLVIALMVLICFAVGVLVRTKFGKWVFALLEANVLLKAPGYSLIKETVAQFLGNKKSPFSSVALVQIYGNDTLVSAFVTDEHDNGHMTVFVPTGPNPTSGNIYHLPDKFVHPVDVPVEDAMRSIISCGAGSSMLITGITKDH